jgi:hypothetical protein
MVIAAVDERLRHVICGMQANAKEVFNPFRMHAVTCRQVSTWVRAQGVMVRKVAPVSRKQIRRVNAVKVDDLEMLQVSLQQLVY